MVPVAAGTAVVADTWTVVVAGKTAAAVAPGTRAVGTLAAGRTVAVGTMAVDRTAVGTTDRRAADKTDRPAGDTGTTAAGNIRWPALGSIRLTAAVRAAAAIRPVARPVDRSPQRSATVGSVDACTLRIRSYICRRPVSAIL